MVATFHGNPKLTSISCYSPTNASTEEDAITFYIELISIIYQVPKHHVLVVGGDMNAKLGKGDVVRNGYHDVTNRNGQFMLDLIKECNLLNISASFCEKRRKVMDFHVSQWRKSTNRSHAYKQKMA